MRSLIILFLPDLDNNNIAIRDEDGGCLARAGWTVCRQQTLISLSLFFITIDRTSRSDIKDGTDRDYKELSRPHSSLKQLRLPTGRIFSP